MKEPKKVATLYVYDYTSKTNWEHKHGLRAFVAPNDDFMSSIFETFEDDGEGDCDYFEVEYVGYEVGDNVGFTKWELKEILELTQEGLEGLGMKTLSNNFFYFFALHRFLRRYSTRIRTTAPFLIYWLLRRGGRAVECGRLENDWA